MTGLAVLHAASTFIMLGVILVVQLVHYPLFRLVGADAFTTYQAKHMRRITWIVLPAMSVELLTAVALVVWQPPGIAAWQTWSGLALIGAIWASTGVLQVPLHQTLATGFDSATHRNLVATNWIRTIAWTLRAGLVGGMLTALVDAAPS
jgi:hypothetical protein